jgi:ferredoxin-type protein NapG
MTVSRRRFLLGKEPAPATKDAEKSPNPAPTPAAEQRPLPRVISWLEEYLPAAPEQATEEQRARPRVPRTLPILRPPGAVEESAFLERCSRCGDCASACPHGAIRVAGPRFGGAEGTPYIDVASQPCWLCEDMPCISACNDAALVANGDRMGTASINRFDCLNSLGPACDVCVEKCPIDGALRRVRGRPPVVESALCVGCGVCAYGCPAPRNAIVIIPNQARRGGT